MQLEHILQAHGLIGRGGQSKPLPTIQNFRGSSNDLGTEIILNWDNPIVIEFQKVQIFMSDTDISNLTYEELVLNGNMIVNAKVSTHTITGLKHNDTRYFKAFGVFTVLGEEKVSSGVRLTVTTKDIIPPATITDFSAKEDNGQVTLTWANPIDSDFSKVKILYKQGSYPSSPSDGMVAYEGSGNTVTITGLTNDVEYYFRAFTYDTSGNINDSTDNQQIKATPTEQKIYGVRIDMNNSNPLTSVVYTDDAVNMIPAPAGGGISEWDNVYPYSEIKPCLLKAGEVQTYLNSSNLAQKADGTPADITTGDNGDVMVEFPVIYWKIWREGQYLYVKYANYKIDSTWKALAHTKGSTLKDNIYIGVFLGYELNGKLRSLSGKTVTANKTIGDLRLLAQANGGGYSQMPCFAVLMLQILYLIKYKSRDSQTALGRGFVDGNSAGTITGGTNAKGIDFGETTGKQQMKFLNIEDFWGNYYCWLDGLVTDGSYNLLYSNDNFNDTGTGYGKFTTGISASISGYIDDVWGSTETGFIIKSKEGSTTTHFCDFGYLNSGEVACFGGHWSNGSAAGFARLLLSNSASDAYSSIAARLFYA